MKIRATLAALMMAGVLLALAGAAAAQQAYPSKPIRIIVPFPPGGSNDIVARVVSQKLAERFGVQTLVDNRGGGNSIIGSEALLKSAPDGYTIMVTSITTHVITPLLMPTPYDAVKDFAAVATIDSSEYLLVVHPSLSANTLQEFIALAKAKPGQLNYASSGSGNANHLSMALLGFRTGINMQHIPYKGGGPAITDLIGGQVQVFFNTPSGTVGYVKNGKLKAIAVTGEARLATLPQVPTFTESGLPDFDVNTCRGILAPLATPKVVIDKLSAEMARILAMPDMKEKLASQGMSPFASTPEQLAARIRGDTTKYAQVIKALNIKADE